MTALTYADVEAARAIRNALDDLHALVPERLGTSGLEARELAVKIAGGTELTAAEIANLLRDLCGIQPTAEQLETLARREPIVVSQATLDYVQELYGTLGVDGVALAAGPEVVGATETGMPAGVAEFFDKPATTGVVVDRVRHRPAATPKRSNPQRAQAKPLSVSRICCPTIMRNCSMFPGPMESRPVNRIPL